VKEESRRRAGGRRSPPALLLHSQLTSLSYDGRISSTSTTSGEELVE